MNAQNSNRFLKIVIVLLILVNASMIAMHFLMGGSRENGPHGARLKDHLIKELKMDEKQESSYSKMVDRHRAAMDDIRKQENETRTALYDDFGNKNLNRDSLYNELGALKREKEVITFNHFQELRTILNDVQATKFDEIIKEAVNGMEGPPGKGPR